MWPCVFLEKVSPISRHSKAAAESSSVLLQFQFAPRQEQAEGSAGCGLTQSQEDLTPKSKIYGHRTNIITATIRMSEFSCSFKKKKNRKAEHSSNTD